MKQETMTLEEAVHYVGYADIKAISRASGLTERSVQSVVYGKVNKSKCVPVVLEYARLKKMEAMETAKVAREMAKELKIKNYGKITFRKG